MKKIKFVRFDWVPSNFKDERQSEKFAQTEIRAGIQLTNKTNKLSVDFRCDGNSSYSQFEYIHFCPMCGRDLFTF